jgi:hypothetical protein
MVYTVSRSEYTRVVPNDKMISNNKLEGMWQEMSVALIEHDGIVVTI